MNTLDCIFVTTGRHPETEKLICKATGSIYSHAAARFNIEGKPLIVEAVRPAVRIVPGDAFDTCQVLQVVSLPISEEQRQAVVKRAFELVGKAYGVDDCVIGGARDVLGDKVAELLDQVIDNHDTYNCSATQTELIRAAFPDFALGHDPSKITPEQARILVLEFAQQMGVPA